MYYVRSFDNSFVSEWIVNIDTTAVKITEQ